MGPDVARAQAVRSLELEPPAAEAVIMLDADQAVLTEPTSPSWIDAIVTQYLAGDPRRILFGATGIDHRRLVMNFRADEAGVIQWCGSGLIFLPRIVWRELRAAHPSPWTHDDPTELLKGEDILLTARARALGIALEPIRGITVAHWPCWRQPLIVRTDAEGVPVVLEPDRG